MLRTRLLANVIKPYSSVGLSLRFPLIFTCFRDEKIVCRAIELNEKLQKVLERHDALLSGQFMSTHNQFNGEEVSRSRANHYNQDEGEDEEAEQLFRR